MPIGSEPGKEPIMSTSAQSTPGTTIKRPFSLRMGRYLLDCLACYAAAN